ncbi:MAG: DUF3048 domain-containing protein [Acidimicrobiales bacterium]|nr:DUF3048 domain-containing protein [Acidimicrobiales bacterium]
MESGHQAGAVSRGALVALATVAVAAVLAGCGSKHKTLVAPRAPLATVGTTAPAPSTTAAPPPVCPLNGEPAPGGKIPQRPALAIKVENLPEARPQYGFSTADVVYEEPVEGGITRFIVIYQCYDAARVEPIRSGRIIDPEIVQQYGAHPLLAYAGAIPPAVSAIDSSSLLGLSAASAPGSVFPRDSSRAAPHNLMSSTTVLYDYAASLHGPQTTPSASPLVFGPQPASATPATSVHIPYEFSDLTWTWEASSQRWTRSYSDTGPATEAEGGQVRAANVIVMPVEMYPSQYVEDPTGSHENLLTLTGSGQVQVFRNGTVTSGTWNRANLATNTTYLDASGQPISLTPGQTWIELVPTTVGDVVTP